MAVTAARCLGWLQVTNAGSNAAARPSVNNVFTLAGIMAILADRANVGVITDISYDGGVDAHAGYGEGGDDNAYVATLLGVTPNAAALASRPTIGAGNWFKFALRADGTNLRLAWTPYNTAAWVEQSVPCLSLGDLTAVYNISAGSSSNPLDADHVCFRGYDEHCTLAQVYADLELQVGVRASIFVDALCNGAGTMIEQSGKGATIADQGSPITAGGSYTFGTGGGSSSILLPMMMHNHR